MTDRSTPEAAILALPAQGPGWAWGDGEMARRIREHDWSGTSLGAIETWSEGPSTLVSQLLSSRMPTKLVWGPELTQVYNDAYIPILGQKHPAALGVPMRVSSPEVWASRAPLYEQGMRDGQGGFEPERELRIIGDDGTAERRWFAVGYAPVRVLDGSVGGVMVTLIETTARVRAEAALRASGERLNLIVDHADIGVLQTGRDSRILFANPAFCALLGYDEATLRTKCVADLTHPDDVASNMAAFGEMLRSGKPLVLEKRYIRADGSVVWVHNNVSFTQGLDGTGHLAIAIVQDITERKQMAEELERRVAERTRQLAASESRARALFANTPDLRTIMRETAPDEFTVLDVNPAVLEATGLPRDAIVGRTIREFHGAETARAIVPLIRGCVASDEPVHYQSRRAMRGAPRSFENTMFRIDVPDTEEGGSLIVTSSRDVTERLALEEQLRQAQKMEAVGQLTGGVAHDFNNLLTAITGNLELIQLKSTDEAARRRAGNAMRAAGRGAELTAQLLAFSRRQFLTTVPVKLNEVVTGMSDMLARVTGGRIEIRTALDPALRPALADPTEIETALLNLVINARDAMPSGGVVTLRTENVPRGTQRIWLGRVPAEFTDRAAVLVTVSDTGSGMTDEVLARACEPFFTTKDVGKGSGLGLSMVYGVAKQLGGSVSIASTVGEGTDVGIFLPVASDDPASVGSEATVGPRAAPVWGADIAVVDDDHDVRELTASFLRDLGHRVIEAASGQDLLAHLRTGAECGLLLIDIAMPGLSGPETAELARRLRPGLPLLFASGYPDIEAFAPGEKTRLLRKPFSYDALAQAVAEALAV